MIDAQKMKASSKVGRRLIGAAARAADIELFDRWFEAPDLSPADVGELVPLLRRALPFAKWSVDDACNRREAFLAHVIQQVANRFGDTAANEIRSVATLLATVESGYRELRTAYAQSPARELGPVERATAVIGRAALAAQELSRRLEHAAHRDGFDLLGVAVPDPNGRPIQPDMPLDVIIRQATHVLKAEGYEQSWFTTEGRPVLPRIAPAGVKTLKATEDVVLNASAFREWEWIEEECRHFGGRVEPVPENPDARWLHRPTDLRWLAFDLAANERLHKLLLQNRVPFERFPDWRGRSMALLPNGNLGPTELHSYATLRCPPQVGRPHLPARMQVPRTILERARERRDVPERGRRRSGSGAAPPRRASHPPRGTERNLRCGQLRAAGRSVRSQRAAVRERRADRRGAFRG